MATTPQSTTLKVLEENLRTVRTKDKRVLYTNQLAFLLKEIDTKRAVSLAQKALAVAKEQQSRKKTIQEEVYYQIHQAKAMSVLCFCLRSTNLRSQAEEYGNKAIAIFEQFNQTEDAAYTRYTLAYMFLFKQNHQQALAMYKQCYAEYELIGNLHMMFATKNAMANVLWRIGEYTTAEEYYKQSIEYAQQNSLNSERASYLVGLGNMYENKSQYNQALMCYKESIRICRTLTNARSLAASLLGVAGICKILGDTATALTHAQEALELFRTSDNKTGVASVLEVLSGIYLEQGEYDKSITTSLKIINELEGTGYARIIAGAFNNIAAIYASNSDYTKSIEHFTKALTEYTTINDIRGICLVNANLAEQYQKIDQWEKAKLHGEVALNLAQIHNFLDFEIEIAPIFGNILEQINGIDGALAVYNQALQKCLQLQHKRGIAILNMYIADLYSRLGKVQKSEKGYHQTLVIAQEVGDKNLLLSSHKSLANLYETHGNISGALYHYKEYNQIDKQLFNENSDKRIKYLQVLHETQTAEKERDIFRLENDKLQSESEFKSKELSAMALHLVQKNEMLETLRIKARAIVESYAEQSRILAKEMVQQIESNIREDNSWESFNQQFTKLHSGFAHILSEKYPNLTPMELKICALLKIQLTTKEIAAALVLSSRTVEDHRNRMRKKFGLTKEDNLSTFLASL